MLVSTYRYVNTRRNLKQNFSKNVRLIASKSLNHQLNDLRELDSKKHYQFVLYKIINKKDFKANNKDECLLYLQSIFNAYQNFISHEKIRNKKLINYWQRYLNQHDRAVVFNVVNVLNKHENFKQLKSYIQTNFKNYNAKEIAFISKAYNSVTILNDDLSKLITGYFINNMNKFDLYDIENITFNNYNQSLAYYSMKSVIKKIVENDNGKNVKLEVDINDDKFENQMHAFDTETQLWLKLKILQNYKIYLTKSQFTYLINYFLTNSIHLTERTQTLYEINCVVNFCAQSSTLRQNREIEFYNSTWRPFLNNNYLRTVFENLNVFVYTSDLSSYFLYFIGRKNNNLHHLDRLRSYFCAEIINTKNSCLFFEYCRTFSIVLELMSRDEKFRIQKELRKDNKSNRYFNSLVDSLGYSFKEILQAKYDHLINKFYGLNFNGIIGSLRFIIRVHTRPNDGLAKFYENFFKFYSTIKSSDLPHYRQQILMLLESLKELKDETTQSNELKLCALLDKEFYYKPNFPFKAQFSLVSFFMLNKKSCLENLEFISETLNDSIIPSMGTLNTSKQDLMLSVDSNGNSLSREYKVEVVQMLSKLFEIYAQEILKESKFKNFNVVMNNLIMKVDQNNVFSRSDKKTIFSFLDEFDLKLSENDAKDYVFNENCRLEGNIKSLVLMLTTGNHYSNRLLDQIWNFLLKTFELFLENSTNKIEIEKLSNLIHLMPLYSHFDYTSNENYLKTYESFKNFNERIYNKILRKNLSAGTLMSYVESLISLNLSVRNAAADLIELIVSFSFF